MLPLLLLFLGLPAHQTRFFAHLIPLWQAIPGRVNARNFSRYSEWDERTFRRWMHKTLPWDELHWGLVRLLIRWGVLGSRFILAIDASFIPKSGKKTEGLGAFWNGSQSRSDTGLELSCLALISLTGQHAFPLDIRQTRPKQDRADRLEQYLEQLKDVLTQRLAGLSGQLRAVVADGQYAKKMFMDAVHAEQIAFVTKLQSNANLLYPFTGAHPTRRGARRKWGGKVDFKDWSGWQSVPGDAQERVWTRVVWAPHFGRFLRVVVIERLDRKGQVKAHVVLCSTDTTMPAQEIRALYSARFQLEFVFRDAKQFAGLTTCQLRSTTGLENHWNAACFALSLGRAEHLLERSARTGRPAGVVAFSYEDVKRRAFNRLFASRILANLGLSRRFVELEEHPSRPLDLGVKAA
ncbi:transposase [Deinococcus sp. RIT780]|uniref:transposase n=1 Tax=Deinococcus sp. RIT780 TaxID=2870472 RepID=UPI001C8A5D27|nr:transposase [Deinococcus sp. RIT780]MBX8464215.1 transposase [Deinococcus sp. RIT780]